MDTVLLSTAEVVLKSKSVRRLLERRLMDYIKFSLYKEGFRGFNVYRMQGRICVEGVEAERAAGVLSKLFGVVSVMPALRTTADLDDIVRCAVDAAGRVLEDRGSFAVRAKVVGEHPYSSRDLEVRVGSEILEALRGRGIHVDLDEPERVVYVEVRGDAAFIYTEVIPGPGGLPYGSQGRLVSLFSGGIDSPVAAWMMMKRGAHVLLLFLDQRPYVGEDYYTRALEAAKVLRGYVPLRDFNLHIVGFGEVMERILGCERPNLRCVLCKRSMYRVASLVAQRLRAQGLVTGESLGQVASQTLHNLAVLSEATTLPIYRPLIGLDKVEIERVARRIGTYEVTAKGVEGCSVVPRRPTTKADLGKVREMEEKLGIRELEGEAVRQMRKVRLEASET